MPIINRQDAAEVEQYITRFFTSPPSSRAQALRRLFLEKLDFASATGVISLANAPKNVALPLSAERIASMEGLHVVYVPLSGDGPDRVRKAEAAAAAKLIADALHGDLLLVMTNPSCSQLHVIYPTFVGAAPSLRRMIIERDLPRRTAVQQLSNIFWQWKDTGSVCMAVDRAFDVDAVTKEFFAKYKSVFESVLASVSGFGLSTEEAEAKKLFVQTLFNRLMFIYFLSRKGWLKFKGDPDYLNALRKDYAAQSEDKDFYTSRLKLLFFAALNNPQSFDLSKNNPTLHSLVGDIPFLNGGLFEETKDDKRPNILVPDPAIDLILRQLFDRFNFTVMESTPFDVEVAVDPEMLGKVFEELVTGRHESGSYYTPRPVVSFMCREALKGYLETQDTSASAEAIAAFTDHKDSAGLTLASAPKVGETLARIKVVDPACGSGAYLLGMMQELVELMTALYSAQLSHQAQDLYKLKLRIIQQNLYGADIDQFAVNIAMLRLWLSLAIEYDGPVEKLPPLPNLDFKIVRGDSLLGPDPSPENYGTLFRHRIHQLAGQLADLKARHMGATAQEKANLAEDVERLKAQLREALADSAAREGVVDWRVEFAEVFDQNGGFDVAIANPPYNVLNKFEAKNSVHDYNVLRVDPMMAVAFGGVLNIFRLFVIRSFQLIRDGGIVTNIVPMALMCDTTSTGLRRFLFKNHQIKSFDAFPERDSVKRRLFEKVKMSTCIIMAQRAKETSNFPVRVHLDRNVSVSAYESSVSPMLLAELDAERLPIPLCGQEDIKLLQALARLPRLGQFATCFTGEIDMTLDRPAISLGTTDTPLLKGAQVQRFRISAGMSQGQFEFVKIGNMTSTKAKKCLDLVATQRIVMQGVTGVNESNRLKVSMLQGAKACANSVNYLLINDLPVDPWYLVGVLNSSTINRFFRSLSTNSNVNGYEVDRLPLATPSGQVQQQIAFISRQLSEEYGKMESHAHSTRQWPTSVTALEGQLDALVKKAYQIETAF
ncbi:MAG: Eco57I restriction-modification methylase domain-containing protein [Chloroflexi bacterium]|nr:Eco57I restriction-modification methylase domain-containing protein [Chloroflexota bacterium]